MSKSIYFFGAGHADGTGKMKELLGGKGAGLAEMTNLGIPVPAGFTITTEICTEYYKLGGRIPPNLEHELKRALFKVEEVMGANFGSSDNPLLLSVRSGARVSMPGMMDTILNLGLNEKTVQGLIGRTKNPRFAFDSYRRFIQMYSDVVLGVEYAAFEEILSDQKKKKNARLDTALGPKDLEELVYHYLDLVKKKLGHEFPSDPWLQLQGAIGAVFRSWNSRRAADYRRIYGYPSDWGTAVNVQAMVFGNMGEDCATGVAFTRDPSTGEKRFFGEYLLNAQGEDVVAGIRTPQPISSTPESLEKKMPIAYRELFSIQEKLEHHYQEMQDIEFTIQKGKVWMLQTRTG
ncbi:MAG: pyruvate, phosphate dikinase, partial [Deltaproteobacteria bacterium]|nr:pyruvate, phosphate dikinase [Deltaproteobacteria bacterium]